MLLAPLCVSLMGLFVKNVHHLPAVEILFFKASLALLASYITLRCQKISLHSPHRSLLLLRGVIGTLGGVSFLIAIIKLSLPSAIILHYTSPLFAALGGIWIAREAVRKWQWLCLGISMVGVACIHGFAFNTASSYVWVGLAGAACRGLAHDIIRKVHTKAHPLVMVWHSSLVAVIVTSTYFLYDFVLPSLRDCGYLLLISGLAYGAHYCTVKAYQAALVARVSAVSYMAVIYSLVWSYMFLGEKVVGLQLLGVGLVLLSVLANAFDQPIDRNP